MMRALYSGVSGLKVHQTKMDVIGNNISNVNTIGFKSSNVTFADVLYQTSSNATGPNPESGRTGQNAMQIGLGANVSSISVTVDSVGGSQRTDNPFDIMIEGDGFFVVNNGSGNLFTRAGSFQVDANGTLCNANGYAVMGWQVDPLNPEATVADNVSPLRIMSAENQYSAPEATTAVHFSGNIDSADTAFDSETGKLTNFTFYDKLGRSYTANLKLEQLDAEDGLSKIDNQYAVTITDVLDSTGNSIFSTYDEITNTYTIKDNVDMTFGGITYEPTLQEDGTVKIVPANGEDLAAGVVVTFNPSTGKFASVTVNGDPVAGTGDAADAEPNYKSIEFSITSTTDGFTDDPSVENAEGDVETNPFDIVDVDFSLLTMYAQSGTTKIEPTKGDIDGYGTGRSAGNMKGVSVDNLGMIYGVYDNGTSRLLGQIVVATFSNPAGLEAVGGSLFATTQNSGDFDGIGESIASTGGSFNTGVVEMSNVDLSVEFTNMITTQRGFQANSRIITTSDTLLEELINLKR
ncbi:MAG: flagellar hook protein FlgE [Lachnospiraceae bacterium]|nr:flagellar hook protein FlgE [Lachnospiraceae bacterium]